MKLVRCHAGHFYDGNKFLDCPHCAGHQEVSVYREYTLRTTVKKNKRKRSRPVAAPIAGWFVCISGMMCGMDYALREGTSRIGLGEQAPAGTDRRKTQWISLFPDAPGKGRVYAQLICRADYTGKMEYLLTAQEPDLICLDEQYLTPGEEYSLHPEQQIMIGELTMLLVPFQNRGYW